MQSCIFYTVYTQWPPGLGMVRSTVTNAQGLELSCYTFPAAKPVSTIIFHHGYGVGGRFEFLRARQPVVGHTTRTMDRLSR